MDEAYRKKLELLSRGALGADNFESEQRKKMPTPINNDISQHESDLVRKAQLMMLDAENKKPIQQQPSLRPPQLSEEAELEMMNELREGEVQPPVSYAPERFNKLKSKYQK